MNARATLSPKAALNALAVGHTLWGAYAYRDRLAGIVLDIPGSVGDGIFDKEHSRDARAAAYWFLFVGPLLTVIARLYGSAEAAGDRPAMRWAARVLVGTSIGGLATIPRSGFPGGLALGLWLMRRAERTGLGRSRRRSPSASLLRVFRIHA
jgi:hypothetical protein